MDKELNKLWSDFVANTWQMSVPPAIITTQLTQLTKDKK